MWKIIIFATLLAVVQPNLQKFIGTWIPVMVFPNVVYIPMCIKYSIYEDYDGQKSKQCTCDDGPNTTLVIMNLVENMNYDRQEADRRSFPLVEVVEASAVLPAIKVSCTCGTEKFGSRLVAKYINKDYFTLYELKNVSYYTKQEPNSAYLIAKNIDTSYKIRNIVKKIPDLKNRSGGIMCSKEIADNHY